MSDLLLGIDLGGTNIKLGICDAQGAIQASASIPTEAERGPQETIDRAAEAARKLIAKTGPVKSCGSGVPGPLDLDRTILFDATNLPSWRDIPYPKMLGQKLGVPTVMENDANCAAWGEYCLGAGRGTKSLVLFTLGTGVGGGIILNGELWVGVSGAAGELGHISIDPKGPACGCGQVGCVEQYASATALAQKYGRGATAKQVWEAARRGDAEALAAVEWATEALAIGCASMIHVLHPEIIVLAGGMAAAGDMLFTRVREKVRTRVFPVAAKMIRIEPSLLGDDAGWLGAALWGARRLDVRPIREPTAVRRG